MKIFIFLVGIGWDWGILGSNDLMNWWDITPPFMYCVFHHISDHLQRLILFWQFYKKVGIRSDPPPPPGWDKIPSLSKELFVWLPLGKNFIPDQFSFQALAVKEGRRRKKSQREEHGGRERKRKEIGHVTKVNTLWQVEPPAKHKEGDEWEEASEIKLKLKVALNKYIFWNKTCALP